MLPSILPIQLLRTCVRLNAPIVRDARPRSAPAAIRWAAAFPSPPPRSQDKNRAQRRDGQTAKPVARPGCSIRSKTLYSPQSTQRAQRKHVSCLRDRCVLRGGTGAHPNAESKLRVLCDRCGSTSYPPLPGRAPTWPRRSASKAGACPLGIADSGMAISWPPASTST